LGAAENDNQGACTIECKLAKCGDQLIWTGKESCDNGPENNDSVIRRMHHPVHVRAQMW
jgi:hypothetical protein